MKRAPKDPKAAEYILRASNLKDKAEIRFLLADYYQAQEMRKRMDMQLRHLSDGGKETIEVTAPLSMTANAFADAENITKKAAAAFVNSSSIGRWLCSHIGIDAIISAGFVAHLEIDRAPTAGHFWAFAGLDPSRVWKKGEKRPYNAALKQTCYHAGECIKRTHNHPDSFYGPIYRDMKAKVVAKNDAGANAERAKTFRTQSAEVTKKLKMGKLPDGNLDRQACNQTVKILLSHLHAVMLWEKFGKAVVLPYSIAMLNHRHFYEIPNAPEGLNEALHNARMQVKTKAA